MRRVAQILCIVNLLALPALATADTGFYLGVGYTEIDAPVKATPLENLTVVGRDVSFIEGEYDSGFFTLGYALNPRFALEVRYARVNDSFQGENTFGLGADRIDSTLEDFYGLYGRLSFRGDKRLRPYLIGGYTEFNFNDVHTVTFFPTSISPAEIEVFPLSGTTDHGFSYGVGANFGLGKHWDLNLEYMNWHTPGAILQNSANYAGFNAGIAFKF